MSIGPLQLEYSHYWHSADTLIQPALHYSHSIIIGLKILKKLNHANNANNVIMQIMQVITQKKAYK